MKSTIKIDYESRQDGGSPCIKIIQPIEVSDINEWDMPTDFDVRDKLIRDFLHAPSSALRNHIFEASGYGPNNPDNATANITIITPVKEDEMFHRIRHQILNRLVPYNSIVELNSCNQVAIKNKKAGKSPMPERGDLYFKIHEFFDWVEKTGYCSFEDQHPYLEKRYPKEDFVLTLRHVLETQLSQDERMAAFDNTPKYKWDMRINDAYQGIDEAFDWATSKEGWDYWEKVAEKLK